MDSGDRSDEGNAQHPNVAVVTQVGAVMLNQFTTPHEHLFAPDFVFHYVNSQLPDLDGDYAGIDGLRRFFVELAGRSEGTFTVKPISVTSFGDEFVVVHSTNTLTIDTTELELDAVVLWRVFDGQVHEAWDVPAVNTVRQTRPRRSHDQSVTSIRSEEEVIR